MLVLTATDVRALLTMPQAIEASREALRLDANGRCDVPLRTNLAVPEHDGHVLVMPAAVPDLATVGLKVAAVFPRGVTATVLLLDGATGAVRALLDGTALTQLRTGALQGAATDALARTDARVGALIGTGGQAADQLEAMLCVRELEEVRVAGRDPERTAAFVARMRSTLADRYGARVLAVASPAHAVDGADLITAVTTSRRPVFDGRLAVAGTHVNGMGAYTPDMQELDGELMTRADRVVIDTAAALVEAGDLTVPLATGRLAAPSVVTLGAVLTGTAPGRQRADQLTVFESVGFAALDVVTAHRVYLAALAAGAGRVVDL